MEQLPSLKQLSESEKEALIIALWEENQRLKKRLGEVEGRLNKPKKGARNSSVPPSQTAKANVPERAKEGVKRQASVGRAGGGRPLHPAPDQVVEAWAKACPHCGAGVGEAEQGLRAVYDKLELPPIRPLVIRVRRYGGHCRHCDRDYIAPVPVGLENRSPFGGSIEALAVYARYAHAISYERLSELFQQVFRTTISEGALANLFKRVKTRLEPRVEEILVRLRSSRLVASDETSARVNGRTQWEWVFQNDEVCVHVIRPSRGQGVIDEVMQGHRPQVWVSDLYSAQRNHPAEQWQVCLAHQLRDCEYAIEAGDRIAAPRLKTLFLRAFAIHKRRDRLKGSTLAQYRCRLQRDLENVLALYPTHPDGIRLLKRYRKLREHLFVFLDDATVPPTNNGSERAIRMSTIFRKVTNGFRSDWGRDLFASIRSVINTGKRQGMSALDAIKKALSPAISFFVPG